MKFHPLKFQVIDKSMKHNYWGYDIVKIVWYDNILLSPQFNINCIIKKELEEKCVVNVY